MAELRPTPTCEVTNLPLSIRVHEPPGAHFLSSDFHHHFHPRRALAEGSASGKALVLSRVQLLPRSIHEQYHRLFQGPEVSTETHERFRLCVLACAGVIPRQAIDVTQPDSRYDLSSTEHGNLVHARTVHIERPTRSVAQQKVRNSIGRFFADYAMSQNIEDVVSEKVIAEFLDTNITNDRQKELGNFILAHAIDAAAEQIEPAHIVAQQEGLVLPEKSVRLRKVVRSFFLPNYFKDYYPTLANKLQAA